MKAFQLVAGTATALIFLAGSAMATPADNIRNSPFTGPYVGVYGGYDWSSADTDVAGLDTDINGWEGGVFAGVRIDGLIDRVNGLGIGLNGALEAFYGVSNSDNQTFEKDNEWGVSFRPGFSFIDELASPIGISPYGILGYRNTKFEATGIDSERYNGYDLGLGAQLLTYGAWGIRGEYTHTWYASKDGIDPDSDEVRVGLSYQF